MRRFFKESHRVEVTPWLLSQMFAVGLIALILASGYRLAEPVLYPVEGQPASPAPTLVSQILPTVSVVSPTPTAPTATITPVPSPQPTVSPTATPAPPSPTAVPTPMEKVHIVKAGETLKEIAIQYGASVEAIVQVNQLEDPDNLAEGQRLLIPLTAAGPTPTVSAPLVHTVQEGETLRGIASQYGISPQAIIEANGLSDPDSLRVGQELIIPSRR
ncbi:MAG: LysM peptidoglycan-binding domain-containing protein [Chloroflexi bacterium]|nr:LysM peptidoglycan-binding domain-containing protein [Chloroflexota bacterium]MCL5075343.1 LysM peptidoglycan-binding domain-containing protein [Chloroflexota bacterium]